MTSSTTFPRIFSMTTILYNAFDVKYRDPGPSKWNFDLHLWRVARLIDHYAQRNVSGLSLIEMNRSRNMTLRVHIFFIVIPFLALPCVK